MIGAMRTSSPASPAITALALSAACAAVAACRSADPRAVDEPTGAAAADASGAPAPAPSPFLPAGYEGELFVDYEALRACDLLTALERMPMIADYLASVAQQYGCELDDLARTRTAVVFASEGSGVYGHSVSVAEVAGSKRPESMPKPWVQVRVGPYDGWWWDGGLADKPTIVWPAPGLVVEGDQALLTAIATGERNAGGPHPQLAPLLPCQRLLWQFAVGRFGKPMSQVLGSIGWFWHDADDPCDFVRLRVWLDAHDELVASLLLRFQRGTSGLREVERDLTDHRDQVLGDKQFAPLQPLARALTVAHQDRDLVLTLPLGTTRQAVGTIERTVLAVMKMRMQMETGARRTR
jgi:hypothetical protein